MYRLPRSHSLRIVFCTSVSCASVAVDSEGTEWIAVRPDSKMDGSKPISGGLSHCFPQFGPGPIQQHGFARNLNWSVHTCTESSATFELPGRGKASVRCSSGRAASQSGSDTHFFMDGSSLPT